MHKLLILSQNWLWWAK